MEAVAWFLRTAIANQYHTLGKKFNQIEFVKFPFGMRYLRIQMP